MARNTDKGVTAVGCIVVSLWALFSIAWIGFIVWAVITLVNWITTK